MCSIAMPAELILGHSPTSMYGHLLYNPLVQQVTSPISSGRTVPPRIRPCLSTGSLTIQSKLRRTNSDDNNNNKEKKKVVFADDRGRPLTQVRVMSEPSNMPPLWTSAYLAGVTRGVQAEAQSSPWEVGFHQPASDYLAFRKKLESNAVSLENVIIREAEQCLVGTVKVKNIAYDKEVVVRASSDDWKTHEDVYCTYVEQPGTGPHAALILYDTFRFKLTLPVNSEKIEFCVKYIVGGEEFWDNNAGKNYIVKKRQEPRSPIKSPEPSLLGPNGLSPRESKEIHRTSEAAKANLRTWSEFASWQHLNNDAPYW